MNTVNNQIFSNFIKTKTPANTQKTNTSPIAIGAGVTATTAIGSALGYRVDKRNKNRLQDSFIRAKDNLDDSKTTFLKSKEIIKIQETLEDQFIFLIEDEKNGESRAIPNCIMLEGKNEELNKNLIKWTGKQSLCNFVEIKHTESLLNCLEKAEENYQANGNRTLIHVDGFEKILNPKLSPPHNIASCKDIMSAVSEDYHSTIIFSAKDPDQLDNIALQPHRVEEWIKVNVDKKLYDNFKSAESTLKKIGDEIKNLKNSKTKIGAAIGLATGIIGVVVAKALSKN